MLHSNQVHHSLHESRSERVAQDVNPYVSYPGKLKCFLERFFQVDESLSRFPIAWKNLVAAFGCQVLNQCIGRIVNWNDPFSRI